MNRNDTGNQTHEKQKGHIQPIDREELENRILQSIDQEEEIRYGFTNDYMFRAVLQTSEEALRGLLSALLYIPESEMISCEICNPIILGNAIDEKNCILDIRVLLNRNRQINLEMQVGSVENWTDRSLYYLCRMYTDLKKGRDYTQTQPSIHIGILTQSPIPEDAAFYNEYVLKNRKTGYEFTGKFALHVLDLSYLSQVSEEEKKNKNKLYDWACVLKAKTWKEMLAMTEETDSIKKAVVTLRQLSEEEKIKQQCEARERYWMDWQSSMRTNWEKGREAGKEEGRNEERKNTEREKNRADAEKSRADVEKNRADSEKNRADKAEEEIIHLREEIERLKTDRER